MVVYALCLWKGAFRFSPVLAAYCSGAHNAAWHIHKTVRTLIAEGVNTDEVKEIMLGKSPMLNN